MEIPGAELTAVCDIVESKVMDAQAKAVAKGFKEPAGYSRGPRDFERLCAEQDLDLVFTATPWEWHVPVMLAAMANGKHAATEVPAAMTIDDCWAIIESAEKHRKHCVMMENCSYDRFELMTLNLVRQGIAGRGAPRRGGLLPRSPGPQVRPTRAKGCGAGPGPPTTTATSIPTHGLGPVANCMDINRGDRFERVVSFSSPSRGLQLWAAENLPADDPKRREKFILGDVNVSLIQTARGRTIYLGHNTQSPRPYSRLAMVQGTKGIASGWPYRVHLEGRSPAHQWEDAEAYYQEFDHPLWQSKRIQEMDRGHGGMDFLEDFRLIECLTRGEPTDFDVYDAAALSSMVELSIRSVAKKGAPVEVPDFTKGRWRTRAPWPIVEG